MFSSFFLDPSSKHRPPLSPSSPPCTPMWSAHLYPGYADCSSLVTARRGRPACSGLVSSRAQHRRPPFRTPSAVSANRRCLHSSSTYSQACISAACVNSSVSWADEGVHDASQTTSRTGSTSSLTSLPFGSARFSDLSEALKPHKPTARYLPRQLRLEARMNLTKGVVSRGPE